MINPLVDQPHLLAKGIPDKYSINNRFSKKTTPQIPFTRDPYKHTALDVQKGDIVIFKKESPQLIGLDDDPSMRDHIPIQFTVNGMGRIGSDFKAKELSKYQKYQFLGIIPQDYRYDSIDLHGVKVQLTGIAEIVNNGPHEIKAGQLLYWKIPDPEKLSSGLDRREFASVGGRQAFWVKPLSEDCSSTCFSTRAIYQHVCRLFPPGTVVSTGGPSRRMGKKQQSEREEDELLDTFKILWDAINELGILFLLNLIRDGHAQGLNENGGRVTQNSTRDDIQRFAYYLSNKFDIKREAQMMGSEDKKEWDTKIDWDLQRHLTYYLFTMESLLGPSPSSMTSTAKTPAGMQREVRERVVANKAEIRSNKDPGDPSAKDSRRKRLYLHNLQQGAVSDFIQMLTQVFKFQTSRVFAQALNPAKRGDDLTIKMITT
jgi:hypothetical protein